MSRYSATALIILTLLLIGGVARAHDKGHQPASRNNESLTITYPDNNNGGYSPP